MLRSFIFSTLALFAFSAAASAAPEIGQPAPAFSGTDYTGKTVKLADSRGHITVLEWNNPGCPFVHKHYDSGSMQNLQAYAKQNNVTWITINSAAPDHQGYMTPEGAKAQFAKNPIIADRYILDSDGKIGQLYGAKTTPHMFVIDKTGTLVYMGAIDDKPTPDPASLNGADNYVKDAIDDLMKNKPIKIASTQSYGCAVKYAY